MNSLRRGWTGEDVKTLQRALEGAGSYRGPVDGVFGGGTESAVRAFQASKGLTADGVVGEATWKALTPAAQVGNDMVTKPLAYRCLALTGTFETGTPPPDCFAGISGDFNGQGLSFGVCQWNIGQGSLQSLLLKMAKDHPAIMSTVFGKRLPELEAVLADPDRADQLAWVRSIQDPRCRFFEPWAGYFKALGRTDEFQQIEQNAAAGLFAAALQLCRDYGLKTERAVALMFDIKTQNGSIRDVTKAQIVRDFEKAVTEVDLLKIVANRRADAAKPQWAEDVRRRKLAIANGGGTVHGKHLDLEAQFGIRLQTAVELT
jgi:hypothetical protein